ncbi:MAG: NAD-dependent epimerase/dehydratase family protein [Planctomycetota bacterium]
MKRVFVTGAAGFIGGTVAEEFAGRGWHVVALARRRTSARLDRLVEDDRATVVRGDAADLPGLRRTLSGERIDAIAHCAGRASDCGPREAFVRDNVDSTAAMVALTKELGVDRLVHVSTTDVYGLRDFCGGREAELPLRMTIRNPYPETKIEAERVVRRGLPPERYAIVRPATVTGPDDTTITPRVLAFLDALPVAVHFGRWRGANRWPLADVAEVARAVFLGATHPEAAGRAIHVLDDERTSADDFYRGLLAAHRPGKRYRSITLPFWVGEALALAVDVATKALGRDEPIADPTRYGLWFANRDLDFDSSAWRALLGSDPAGSDPI